MKIFEELNKENTYEMDKRLTKYYKDNNIFEKTIENRENNENFVFYDGPIYANAKPGAKFSVTSAIDKKDGLVGKFFEEVEE